MIISIEIRLLMLDHSYNFNPKYDFDSESLFDYPACEDVMQRV